jgi:hypothetical protein
VKGKWENSSWGRKLIVQKRRAALNDFDRFKVMLVKIKVRNPPVKWLISVARYLPCTLLTPCFFVLVNRGVVLSGKSLPSSRRPRQHRMARRTALFSFWFQVGSPIGFSVLKARISTAVSCEPFGLYQAQMCLRYFVMTVVECLRWFVVNVHFSFTCST